MSDDNDNNGDDIDSLTLRIVREIRDEHGRQLADHGRQLGELRDGQEGLHQRMARMEGRFDDVDRQLAELRGMIGGMHDMMIDRLDLDDRVRRCEGDIVAIKHRLDT